MATLSETKRAVTERFGGLSRIRVPPEELVLRDDGVLSVSHDSYQLHRTALASLARFAGLPAHVVTDRLTSEERAFVLQGRIMRPSEHAFPECLRLTIDDDTVIGLDDAHLLSVDVLEIIEIVERTLPKGLTAEEISIDRISTSGHAVELTVFTPLIEREPRLHDVVNGGVYLRHPAVGEYATEVRCYLRRLVCKNGMVAHVCVGSRQARTRRLRADQFSLDEVRRQIEFLLTQAWDQVGVKAEALAGLLDQPPVDQGIFHRLRSRFSLNQQMIEAIRAAEFEDEKAPTDSFFDFIMALSRVATHPRAGLVMTPRQQRTLMRAAGEMSQNHVHRCPSCGTWVEDSGQVRTSDRGGDLDTPRQAADTQPARETLISSVALSGESPSTDV